MKDINRFWNWEILKLGNRFRPARAIRSLPGLAKEISQFPSRLSRDQNRSKPVNSQTQPHAGTVEMATKAWLAVAYKEYGF
jgi:hypothetical protein